MKRLLPMQDIYLEFQETIGVSGMNTDREKERVQT
jgi:hypothetical protein